MSRLKVLSLFSGIGAFEKALSNLGIDFELVGFSEIDKFAIESYCTIHKVNKSKNLGDVSKVETDSIRDFDLMTYGFPCQDISVAGRQRGFSEDSETRSSLLWEAMKIAKEKKPKYMIAENVKNLIGKKFKDDFDKWLTYLDELGYNTYHSVLNAKEYGVPQNRERVFVVSIRKDIDNGKFDFPIGKDYNVRLKDILEEKFDDKYYLSEEVQKRFKFNEKYHKNIIGSTAPDFRTIGQRDLVYKTEGIMGSLVATDYKQPKQIIEGFVSNGYNEFYNDYAPTQTTYTGSTTSSAAVLIKNATKKGYLEAYDGDGVDLAYPDSETRRGRVQPQRSHTLTTSDNLGVLEGYKIRKLTPKECWRLMGFTDEDFGKAKLSLNQSFYKGKDKSDSQLYKQAGNSIVVKVLESLLHNLLK